MGEAEPWARRLRYLDAERAEWAERESRESQREAVLDLTIPLLTAWERALPTSRSWAAAPCWSLASMAPRVFLMSVLSRDLTC